VDVHTLSVRQEKGVSAKDRAEVQADMQDRVLQSAAYPEIVFRSTQVRRYRENNWTVSGDLTLHGVTKPVTLDVAGDRGVYAGVMTIKQTDFGIQPIKIGSGVVKVKDELDISFRTDTQYH
jgi:polyisoprenoid-binding protein YceI